MLQKSLNPITQQPAGGVQTLEERCADPLLGLVEEVAVLSNNLAEHLKEMGVAWK